MNLETQNLENLRTPNQVAAVFVRERLAMIPFNRKGLHLASTNYRSTETPINDKEYEMLLRTIPEGVRVDILPPENDGEENQSYLLHPNNMPSNFADFYPEKLIVTLAAIPFDTLGRLISELQDEEKAAFLENGRLVNIWKTRPVYKNLTLGFGDVPGYFYDLLPEKLKQDVEQGGCSFEVKYPAPTALNGDIGLYLDQQQTNKQWLYTQQVKALQNLQEMLEKAWKMDRR